MTVDAELVRTWLEGWAISRGTTPPTAVSGGWRVDVGWPAQKARLVFPAPCPDLVGLGEAIEEKWVFLKVCAEAEAIGAILSSRWDIQPQSFFMGCDGPMAGGGKLPDAYRAETIESADGAEVRVTDKAGVLAASGYLALTERAAVYDRIVTHEDHRRRGLAGVVMRDLETSAQRRGLRRGLLVATADGHALYRRLGWTVLSPYTSAVIPG